MKKILVIVMAVVMTVSFAACTAKNGNGGSDKPNSSNEDSGEKMDLSAYPADFSEWTIDNMMEYFTQAGCFTDDTLMYVQNEEECDPASMGLSKCGSYLSTDEMGNETVFIFYFDPAASQSKVKEQFDYIKANKTFDETLDMQPVDHVIGNFAISYSLSVDDDFYNAMDKAYNDLVASLEITPEF